MNIASNPWSFTSADVITATPSASPTGLVMDEAGNVTLTAGSSLNAAFVIGAYVTLINPTLATYKGNYRILSLPSAASAYMRPITPTIVPGLAASGGGTLLLTQYEMMVRAEDMSWQNAAAAGDEVIVYDRNGNLIWDAIANTDAPGNTSRSKPYWTSGLAVGKLSSGTLVITVN